MVTHWSYVAAFIQAPNQFLFQYSFDDRLQVDVGLTDPAKCTSYSVKPLFNGKQITKQCGGLDPLTVWPQIFADGVYW